MTVYAAGALCWRLFLGEPHVLVVYRKRHKDLSFPKGKVEPGELLSTTAVREVGEETGLTVALGANLGVVRYLLPNGAEKEVHYWESQLSEATILRAIARFTPNDEVSELRWLSFDEARRQLSYEHDLDPLDRLEKMIGAGLSAAYPVLVLRHGKALARSSWGKSEATRPLTTKGTGQAASLVTALGAWRPRTIISSPWERCLRTISPYAEASGTALARRDKLTEAAAAAHPEKTRHLVRNHALKGRPVLFCTHRPVLPLVADAIEGMLADPAVLDRQAIETLDTGAFVIATLGAGDEAGGRLLFSQETVNPLDA